MKLIKVLINRRKSPTQTCPIDFDKGAKTSKERIIIIVFSTNDAGRIRYPEAKT